MFERAGIGEDCCMDFRTYLPAAHVGDRCVMGLRIGHIVLESVSVRRFGIDYLREC